MLPDDRPSSVAALRSTPVRLAPLNAASLKLSLVTVAFARFALCIMALSNDVPVRFAPDRSASIRVDRRNVAPVRFAPEKLSPVRSKEPRPALVRSQPLQSTPAVGAGDTAPVTGSTVGQVSAEAAACEVASAAATTRAAVRT